MALQEIDLSSGLEVFSFNASKPHFHMTTQNFPSTSPLPSTDLQAQTFLLLVSNSPEKVYTYFLNCATKM